MKYLFIFFLLSIICSCTKQDCYECLETNANFEASDQFNTLYDFTIPNWAIEGQETIPLFDIYSFDTIPVLINDPILQLKGANAEILFNGDASSLLAYGSRIEVPISIMYSQDKLLEGQIYFKLSFKESVTNMPFSIEGSFLLISCDTFLDNSINIKNRENCRDNIWTSEFTIYNHGC